MAMSMVPHSGHVRWSEVPRTAWSGYMMENQYQWCSAILPRASTVPPSTCPLPTSQKLKRKKAGVTRLVINWHSTSVTPQRGTLAATTVFCTGGTVSWNLSWRWSYRGPPMKSPLPLPPQLQTARPPPQLLLVAPLPLLQIPQVYRWITPQFGSVASFVEWLWITVCVYYQDDVIVWLCLAGMISILWVLKRFTRAFHTITWYPDHI